MRTDGKLRWLRDVLADTRHHADVNTFASLGDRIEVEAGRVLARTGEFGREAFFIVAGRIEVRRDGEQVALLGPGDVAGELAVTGAVRRNADLVAATDAELIVFDGASFRSAMHLSETLARQVEGARTVRTVA